MLQPARDFKLLKHTSKRFPMLKHTSKRLAQAQLQETSIAQAHRQDTFNQTKLQRNLFEFEQLLYNQWCSQYKSDTDF